MSSVPEDLLYTKDHEWVRLHEDGTATVGITDYAQESLGDITFIEFPDEGASFQSGETFGVVESVKAASDLYMPLAGEVIAINAEADGAPDLLNSDPYAAGWLLKIRLSEATEAEALLKPGDYIALT
ncbi:MAG: glycine cleavage system protein GcvH [Verrucomicrobia bacterium]|nr:glycine cleavage system protein GcvH [Verrucomicrobiota bacterium]